MHKIATYKNGNTTTTIYDDGTKTHFTMDDEFKFAFSESCDISISQCCDNGCEWCYYGCSPTGKHGKLTGWKFFETMHPYTEIAINLQYPIPDELTEFLNIMKNKNIIVNATINQNHFMNPFMQSLVKQLVDTNLIKGIGISLTDPTQKDFINMVKRYPNAVIHVIAGVTSPEDIDYLKGHDLKLLILGYKKLERGKKYYDHSSTIVEDNIKWLESDLDGIINGFKVVSFDNLAIEQLHLKDKLSDKEWEMFYGGDDGTVTFFIDLVKGVFARSSLSRIVYTIGDKTIDEMFEVIKEEIKKGSDYIQLIINKPIRLIELFSGIGFQRMALKDIGAKFESWKTCEWDINAIKQYKAIHCSNNIIDYSCGKTKEELIEFLFKKGISNDGKKSMLKSKIAAKSEKWLREIYNNCCAMSNLIDISKVNGEELQIKNKDKYCYLLTYSCPCTNLSIAGLQNGMKKEDKTASGLLWEVKRILSECIELPQILLMENVTQIHSKKNLPQFGEWIKFLESLGYSNFWQDMNAKDYGIPQSRNRTFMISILDPTKQITFDFPSPIKLNKNFIDLLVDEDTVEEKFYINSPESDEVVQKLLLKNNSIFKKKRVTIDLSLNDPEIKTIANCITAHLAKDGNWIERRKSKNNGVVIFKNKKNNTQKILNVNYKIRKITPNEAFRLMGCSDNNFKKAEAVVSNTSLYKAAGNGIVKNCLEAIFCQMNINNVLKWDEYSKKY